mmetsp:Transcript_2271/g.3815  ORF Transcript_2271/g.3815 Transcript_2271/m.3815 type:complete len:92 (-) Transcript_2271:38-313(-)
MGYMGKKAQSQSTSGANLLWWKVGGIYFSPPDNNNNEMAKDVRFRGESHACTFVENHTHAHNFLLHHVHLCIATTMKTTTSSGNDDDDAGQ